MVYTVTIFHWRWRLSVIDKTSAVKHLVKAASGEKNISKKPLNNVQCALKIFNTLLGTILRSIQFWVERENRFCKYKIRRVALEPTTYRFVHSSTIDLEFNSIHSPNSNLLLICTLYWGIWRQFDFSLLTFIALVLVSHYTLLQKR